LRPEEIAKLADAADTPKAFASKRAATTDQETHY